MAVGNGHDWIHVTALTVQMDGDDALGVFCNETFYFGGINGMRPWIDVAQDYCRTVVGGAQTGGNKGVAGYDDFVPGSNVEHFQSQNQCVGALIFCNRKRESVIAMYMSNTIGGSLLGGIEKVPEFTPMQWVVPMYVANSCSN